MLWVYICRFHCRCSALQVVRKCTCMHLWQSVVLRLWRKTQSSFVSRCPANKYSYTALRAKQISRDCANQPTASYKYTSASLISNYSRNLQYWTFVACAANSFTRFLLYHIFDLVGFNPDPSVCTGSCNQCHCASLATPLCALSFIALVQDLAIAISPP